MADVSLQKNTSQINPIAIFHGQSITDLPQDLYIPPDALRVFLEAFEGPLDLLLYLIRKNNLDILDIPIAKITAQYMEYVELMRELRLELAAEYLVMAAMLAEIKSRMLLPRSEEVEEEEGDPRAELIRRLQEYECFQQAALKLDELPRRERDIFQAYTRLPDLQVSKPQPQVELRELLMALKTVMQRAQLNQHHHIQRESLSVRERMTQILDRLQADTFTEFTQLFKPKEGKQGVVVTFLALLELVKQAVIELMQNGPYSPIHVRVMGN